MWVAIIKDTKISATENFSDVQYLPSLSSSPSPIAGKKVTEDEVEEMLESDNPVVFTKDVSNQGDLVVSEWKLHVMDNLQPTWCDS